MNERLVAILEAEDKNFTSTFEKCEKVSDGFGNKLKKGIGFGAWMAIGQKAVNFVFGQISQNVDGAVKRLDTLNNFPKVMQSLGFSAEEAEKGINSLANSIDHLPTTLDAVASQAQQFVPMTGSIEKATQVTLALNNAMAAGGKDAGAQQRAIEQWTKAMAKGKPDFEMWQSMVQTAPAQMDQLAKSMLGASAGQNDLYNAMKEGSISIDEVNDKMIELTNASGGFDIAGRHYDSFAKQAENASAGIQMSITNVKAAIQRNLANVFDSLDKKLEKFGGISGIIQGIVNPINRMGDTFKNVISGTTPLGDAVEDIFTSIGKNAKKMIPKGMELVSNFIEGIFTQLPQIMVAGANLIANFLEGIISGFPKLLTTAINALAMWVKGLSDGKNQLASRGVELIKALAKGLWDALPEILKAIGNLLKELAIAIWNNKTRLLKMGWELIKSMASGIGKAVGALKETAANIMSQFLQKITEWLGKTVSKAREKAKQIPTAIKNGIGSLASVGRDFIQGLWNGIKAKFESVINWAKKKAEGLPKAIKKVLGIASPSKVMKQIGLYTGEGLMIGLEKSTKGVQNAMANMMGFADSRNMMYANATLSDEYIYTTSARYEITVPFEINGREFARATATDMQTAINRNETLQNRRLGLV